MKGQPPKWEKICANLKIFDKILFLEYIFLQLKNININKPILRWAKDMNRNFSEEDIKMYNTHLKRCSTTLASRNRKIKTIMRHHFTLSTTAIIKETGRGASRRWKSMTWRSPSSPQVHQKYIYMWNNSYRTPNERWQKTSDLPKGKKLPMYLGRAKEKRNRDKRIGTGPAPVGGSCEGGKVSTH